MVLVEMSDMEYQLNKLAESNDLNVEDIIEAAQTRDAVVSRVLRELQQKYRWPERSIRNENGGLTPPMGMWVNVACAFIESGYKGIIEFSDSPEKAHFALSFLQECNEKEAIEAILKIVEKHNGKNTLFEAVKAFNLILSFPDAPALNDEMTKSVRGLIHHCIGLSETDTELGTSLCALRGVGNDESIALMSGLPRLKGSWEGTEKLIIKAIRAKGKSTAKP